MEKPVAPPRDVLHQLERLQDATRLMPGLASEIDSLQERLERGDMAAAHVGIRTSAEALLRHVMRVEGLPRESGPSQLHTLEQTLRPKLKGRVDDAFWDDLTFVQRRGNRHAHAQLDDVYHAAGLRPADPWAEVGLCLGHLASMVSEFVRHWPPPAGLAADLVEDDPTAPPSSASPEKASPRTDSTTQDLREISARQALDDDGSRRALEALTGMSRSGITRRLHAVHGRTKVRNVFPDHFGADAGAGAIASISEPEDVALDYEAIGNLTINQARQLEVAGDIARLTGSTELAIKRRLATLNGNGVIRRQFPWYEAARIGELTVRAALDYRLAPVLARAFGARVTTVESKLREAAGQTKLRTIFPELDA